jgi:cytochrome c
MKTSVAVTALIAAVALTGCGPRKNQAAENAAPATPAETPAAVAPAGAASAPAGVDEATAKRLLAELPAPYATADIVHGKQVFARCRSCHTTQEGGPDMTGPNLWGVFGRKAGSKPGYTYSDAVKNAGWTWDPQRLDKWLENPRADLPGTKMSFVGLKDPKDRQDVIAYLHVATAK